MPNLANHGLTPTNRVGIEEMVHHASKEKNETSTAAPRVK